MLQPRFENIRLNSACELLCADCPCWPNASPLPAAEIQSQRRLVNLAGGDPLNHPELGQMLARLKRRKHLVTLTTGGYRLENLEPQFLRLLDFIFLYVPACTAEKSVLRCGLNAWKQQLNAIEYLQEIRQKFAVLYPVDRDTLEDLPDLYHKLNRKNSYLAILRNKKSENAVSRPAKAHLYYYGRKSNALVYEYRKDGAANCLDFLTQLEQPGLYNYWTIAKVFYKFAFLG
jgi:MoaA/NifB/PqqE/SkfB family radical SAM enzyme